MISALGYSNGDFDPAAPGRLCRGRERWIESFPLDQNHALHRIVISGARFSDDSASDALRGLPYSGLNAGQVLRATFSGQIVLAVAEDGHPQAVPARAFGLEHFEIRRPGGPLVRWGSRWLVACDDAASVEAAIAAGAEIFVVLEEAPTAPPDWLVGAQEAAARRTEFDAADPRIVPESLRQALFLLNGHRQDGPPVRSFQPAALPDVLGWCKAVVLVHQDKHSHCLGIYSKARVEPGDTLSELAFDQGTLPVPFAIPPMLARWDRALWELRQGWDEAVMGEFPVPPFSGPQPSWARGRRRRGMSEE